MSVIIAHSTKDTQLTQKKNTQEKLEMILNTIDQIKRDLNRCGMGIPKEQPIAFSYTPHGFKCKFQLVNQSEQNIEYKYYPDDKRLTRRVNHGYYVPLLENVSDFYVTYFPDSNSVLYRIEIDKKEQVRGYIFLLNVAN